MILQANLADKLQDRLSNVLEKYSYESNLKTEADAKATKATNHFKGGALIMGLFAVGGFATLAGAAHFMGGEGVELGIKALTVGTLGGWAGLAYAGIAGLAAKVLQNSSNKLAYKSQFEIQYDADEKLGSRVKKIEEKLGVEFSSSDLDTIKNMQKDDNKKDIIRDIISRTKLKS